MGRACSPPLTKPKCNAGNGVLSKGLRIFSWWQKRCAFVLRKKIKTKNKAFAKGPCAMGNACLRPHYL
ncbi:Hypothetical protein I595_3726 [Croceitalea dokdonensis DOKDO 023]|uniref:Uncharacterized protein n=1 Tax=Croceitalea dokdonensis DOKDO 023 TaxID=1300341 RepID=A0A0P7AMB3_9FLAO|nr:Hypothetical protein I595_3726 [Croceitalea dokdonensis DOKDO 023]